MTYDNEKKFALFKNDKGDNQKRPDYRGTLTVEGVEYAISGWIAKGPKGAYIRGEFKAKENRPQPKPTQNLAASEDVPF
jgi:hypothetical protein